MDVRDQLAGLSAAAWTYTAIGVAIELGLPGRLREPTDAAKLANAAGIPVPLATSLAEALVAGTDGGFVAEPELAEMAAGPQAELLRADTRTGLLQMAALFDAATLGSIDTGWTHTDERILQAQGTMSAAAVDVLERHALPYMPGMLDRLDSGEGAFLDVGAGVAAVSIAFCRLHPLLRAVALEPFEPARRLAERNVADAGLADRLEVHDGRVEALAGAVRPRVVAGQLPGAGRPAERIRGAPPGDASRRIRPERDARGRGRRPALGRRPPARRALGRRHGRARARGRAPV